jgi:hypothetical protein
MDRRTLLYASSASLLGALAQVCASTVLAATGDVPPETIAKILAHSNVLVITRGERKIKPTKVVEMFWAPNCEDTMKFYRDNLRSIVLNGEMSDQSAVVLHLVARNEFSIPSAVALALISPADYYKAAIGVLEYGARTGNGVPDSVIPKIIAHVGASSNPAGDKAFAEQCVKGTNQYAAQVLRIQETPTLFANGKVMGGFRFVTVDGLHRALA